MENAGGGGGGGDNSMLSQNNSDLDNLSNLLINSYEDDAAILDQYELEVEKNLQESLMMEKEQHIQRLFQSFQTSACAVAQMFKDKSAANATSQSPSVLSSWESFQNSAGAITVLYKDSLEACRVHMELGIHLGQQRKLKDLINWIKKKKKRSIRKDELISFLIGKQYPSQNQMFNLFRPQSSTSNPFNANLGHLCQQASNSTNRHRNQQILRQRSSLVSTNSSTNPVSMANNVNNNSNNNNNNTASANMPLIANPALNLINNGENSNGSEVDNTSDLATFREALIMHNRSRDTPLNRNHPSSHNHNHNHTHTHHTTNSSNQSHLHTHNYNNNNNSNVNSQTQTNQQPQQQQQADSGVTQQQNCDDLDCFFCEQIATHIEHKRSSANLNFDADSPTRKRSRFY